MSKPIKPRGWEPVYPSKPQPVADKGETVEEFQLRGGVVEVLIVGDYEAPALQPAFNKPNGRATS